MIRFSVVGFLFITGIFAASVSAKVGFGPGKQDYGYLDVRPGAHMFFWLYYTTANVTKYTDRPLTIWLQGGPGASSTSYGNFEELGPLDVNLKPRAHTWVKDMNVLFIDNPVGTGFSYVDDIKDLTKDNKMIAADLVTFMKEFYKTHPEFKAVPLHIFCESYGGKMASEFALELNKAIKNKEIDCNLKSVALGDSWIAPIVSVNSWAPVLMSLGIVDYDGYLAIMKAAKQTEIALNNGEYVKATTLWGQTEGVVLQESKGVDFYNMLLPTKPQYVNERVRAIKEDTLDAMYKTLVLRSRSTKSSKVDLDTLMRNNVSSALGIPDNVVFGSQSGRVFNTLAGDFMKPVIHIVEELLNTTDIHVIVYTGQLDLICSTPATVDWVNSLEFPNKQNYVNASRKAVVVNEMLEGYTKHVDKFSMYWVNRAGHMVPADNPAAMDYILRQVTQYDKL